MKKYSERKIHRREFLEKSVKAITMVSLVSTFPTCIISCTQQSIVEGPPKDYYTSRKRKLLKAFNQDVIKPGRKILVTEFGDKSTDSIINKASHEYESLLHQLPYIGGEENLFGMEKHIGTSSLIVTAQCLAIYKVLKDHGKEVREIGKIMYDVAEARFNRLSKYKRYFAEIYVDNIHKNRLPKQALESQKSKYPEDHVFKYIEGNGQEFDYGVDTIECANLKFARTQDAEEMIPYLCLLDFPLSKALNRGLTRTMTIAEGAEICDFRYKKGRETQKGWPPAF